MMFDPFVEIILVGLSVGEYIFSSCKLGNGVIWLQRSALNIAGPITVLSLRH
jgi:hypothetical protein